MIFYGIIISCLCVEPLIFFDIIINIKKNDSLSYIFKYTIK